MSKKQSLKKLSQIIDNFSNVEGGMLYRNAFAMACYLSIKGETSASQKMLRKIAVWIDIAMSDVLGWDGNKTYYSDIMNSMDAFASDYANQILPNVEIHTLF